MIVIVQRLNYSGLSNWSLVPIDSSIHLFTNECKPLVIFLN